MRQSFVYFIRCTATGRIKIGHSRKVGKRLSDLRCAASADLELVAWMDGSPSDEAYLHRRFEAARVRLEWFDPSDELLAFIEALPDKGPIPPPPQEAPPAPSVLDVFRAAKKVRKGRRHEASKEVIESDIYFHSFRVLVRAGVRRHEIMRKFGINEATYLGLYRRMNAKVLQDGEGSRNLREVTIR